MGPVRRSQQLYFQASLARDVWLGVSVPLPRWGWWSTDSDPVKAAAGDLWFTTQTAPCSRFLTTCHVQSASGHLQTVFALHQCDIRSVSDQGSNINIHICICYLISSFAFSISLWAYFNTGQTPGENRLGSLNSANSCSSTEKQVWSWKDSTELYRKAPSFSFTNKTICSNTDTKAGAVTEACRTIAWTAHKPTHKRDEAQLQHCVVTAENCC